MATSFKSDLRKAYKAAKRELNELFLKQQRLEKDLVKARQNVNNLKSVCESAGVKVESSSEAAYLLQKSPLGDEVRSILVASYPGWTRPNQVVAQLERIGHDLSKLSNPQASIQMILKRMVESEEAQEARWPGDGKKVYRMPRTVSDLEHPTVGMTLADIPERGKRALYLADLNIDLDKLPDEIRASLYGSPGRVAEKPPADHPLHKLKARPNFYGK